MKLRKWFGINFIDVEPAQQIEQGFNNLYQKQPQNWYAYLYINKSKTADASYFAHTQTGAISGILNYVATMTRNTDTEIKIIIKRKETK